MREICIPMKQIKSTGNQHISLHASKCNRKHTIKASSREIFKHYTTAHLLGSKHSETHWQRASLAA